MRSTLAIRAANQVKRAKQLESRQKGQIRIAVWDIGISASELGEVLEEWNALKGPFAFTQVFISAPRQLLLAGERTIEVAKKWIRDVDDRPEIQSNIFVEGVNAVAEDVRRRLGFDKIAVLTPHMLAFLEGGGFCYNYFSVSMGRVIIVSGFDLRNYARKARRPFASAVGGLLLAQVLVNEYPRLGFHQETRGCLLDFNRDRGGLVQTLRKMRVEKSCLEQLPESARAYAAKMADILAEFE